MSTKKSANIVKVTPLRYLPTFLPRHVQQPARERCDRRVALLEPAEVEDEVEVAVKPDGRKGVEEEESSLSVRGARGGR